MRNISLCNRLHNDFKFRQRNGQLVRGSGQILSLWGRKRGTQILASYHPQPHHHHHHQHQHHHQHHQHHHHHHHHNDMIFFISSSIAYV